MALEVETGYYDKNNKFQSYKYKRMKVMGKLMDDNESHTFTVLTDNGVQTFTPGAPVKIKATGEMKLIKRHTCFVKYPGGDEGFILDLSEQAKYVFDVLKLQKRDKITIKKEYRPNEKDGSTYPVIAASVERDPQLNSVGFQTAVPDPTEDFLKKYGEFPKEKQEINHMLATYFLTVHHNESVPLRDKFVKWLKEKKNAVKQC